MSSRSTLTTRRRAVPLYAVLCAMAGLSGLALSLAAHPDGMVYHFEQMAAGEAAGALDRTALLLHADDPAPTL